MKNLAGLLLVVPLLIAAAPARPAELVARSSSAAGVTVKVTPKEVSPQSVVWTFAVVLDTHSQELNDDLAKSASLVDARGGRHAPLAWEGAPAGGHHRAGVLRFKAPGAQQGPFELQIQRAGEQSPRVFRWTLQ